MGLDPLAAALIAVEENAELLKGAQGEQGPEGKASFVPGPVGPAGQDGADGKDGEPGVRGVRGPKGEKGDKGEPGKDGKDGRDGKDGKDAAMPIMRGGNVPRGGGIAGITVKDDGTAVGTPNTITTINFTGGTVTPGANQSVNVPIGGGGGGSGVAFVAGDTGTAEDVNDLTFTGAGGAVTEVIQPGGPGTSAQVTITAGGGGGAVDSVNGQTGVVVLDAGDVGADVVGAAAAAQAAAATDATTKANAAQAAAEAASDPVGSAAAAQAASQPLNTNLTALGGLTSAANKGIQYTGSGTAGTYDLTAAAKTVLDDATVAAMVDTLGGASSTGTGGLVRAGGPTFTAPVLGTPASGVATNLTGTAAGLTAGTVTTNANLTGDVSSVGNATTIGAGKVTEAMQVLADNTTQDVSTSKHGYAPKAPNDATQFLNGANPPAWAVPAGTGGPNKAGTCNVDIGSASLVDIATVAITLAVGDVVRVELYAEAGNSTGGARTITFAIECGSVSLSIAGSATVGNTTNTAMRLVGYVSILATNDMRIVGEATMNPQGAGTGVAVSPVVRSSWQSSGSNLTGSQTIRIRGTTSNGTTGFAIRGGYMIQKMQV